MLGREIVPGTGLLVFGRRWLGVVEANLRSGGPGLSSSGMYTLAREKTMKSRATLAGALWASRMTPNVS